MVAITDEPITIDHRTQVGFIGTGTMGEPMAQNLLRAGVPLIVWNRTVKKTRALEASGAHVVSEPSEVFENAHTIILMLIDSTVVDAVLSRGTPQFATAMRGRSIIQMGTVSPAYSLALSQEIATAGGHYIEAPVSGQREPAIAGQLITLVSGVENDIRPVRHLFDYMCREVVLCGPVPNALSLKLATNLFVGTMLACLAEAFNFARHQGLNLDLLATLLSNGPMASDLVRMKAPKLVARDFTVQASITALAESSRLIIEQAGTAHIAVPMLEACAKLCQEAVSLGLGQADVTALSQAIEELYP